MRNNSVDHGTASNTVYTYSGSLISSEVWFWIWQLEVQLLMLNSMQTSSNKQWKSAPVIGLINYVETPASDQQCSDLVISWN